MIIGISGKIGAGKDTLAQCIISLDPSFKIVKYADKLKYMAWLLTGEDQWSQKGKQKYLPGWRMTVGQLQQKLGTEAIRNGLHPDAWVLALFEDYRVDENWIITDVRFPNEADEIDRYGGLLVRIEGTRVHDDARDHNHPSEISLDKYPYFDYRFDNSNLTMNKLMFHASAILTCVRTKYDIRSNGSQT